MENDNFKGKNLAARTLNQVNKVQIICNENIVCLMTGTEHHPLAFLPEMDSDLIFMKQQTRLNKGTFHKVIFKNINIIKGKY